MQAYATWESMAIFYGHVKPTMALLSVADISQLHLVDESWHVSLDEFETWKSNQHFKIIEVLVIRIVHNI